jgi:Mg2+ and Co2+ transporter CorA
MTITAYLYDESGADCEIDLAPAEVEALSENQILWIDAIAPDAADRNRLVAALGVTDETLGRLLDTDRPQHLDNYGDYIAFGVPSFAGKPVTEPSTQRELTTLGFVVGRLWLLTIHAKDVTFLSAFQAQDKGETKIGGLPPSLLAVSLLDWHVSEYFDEVARIESRVDDVDEVILADGAVAPILAKIVENRRDVSKLRTLISKQRPIFYGLSRPDFALGADPRALAEFAALAARYERAVDEIERGRDVVVGSFELFTSMTTQKTNDLVKALTFLTAIIGICAAVAGLLGMNFEIPLFKTGMIGFGIVVTGLVVLAAAALALAKWRRWI